MKMNYVLSLVPEARVDSILPWVRKIKMDSVLSLVLEETIPSFASWVHEMAGGDPDDRLLPHNITRSQFHRYLDLYVEHVRDVYQDADNQRFKEIPGKIKSRKEKHGEPPFLTRIEVLDLEKWIRCVSINNTKNLLQNLTCVDII